VNEIIAQDVVFCEGFRNEIGGKHTLFGVSAPEINIPQLPATIVYAVWISGKPTSIGTFDIEFRARNEDGLDLVRGKLGGETNGLGLLSIPIGPFPLNIEKQGDITFEWCFDSVNWKKIGTLKINQLPLLPSEIPR
jgi:hypothetical protein